MKTSLVVFSILAATAISHGDDLVAVRITNAKGQGTTLYRHSDRKTVALFHFGRKPADAGTSTPASSPKTGREAVAASTPPVKRKVVLHDNGHGQQIVRRVRQEP